MKTTYIWSMECAEPLLSEMLEALLKMAAISLSTSMYLSAFTATRSLRAMICAFLGTVLPAVDADVPRAGLPVDDNLFDLIPASKLELRNVRPRGAAPHRGAG